MYRKYAEVWAEHAAIYGPRTALLFQVGGFFEIYDTENLTTGSTTSNIREVAELCQLSLTTHEVDLDGEKAQTLFGGFPVDALPKFERILVGAGWTVVVVVQRKDSSGKVEERVVDHISSPGCFLEGLGLEQKCLVGCVLESAGGPAALQKVYWAVAALDLATGRIWFAEGGSVDRLHQFLCMHPPAELVIWSDGLPASGSLTDVLKGSCAATHIKCLGPASAAVDESVLARFWNMKTLAGWMSRQPASRRCLAALMDFAAAHVPSALSALEAPELWVPDGEVRLGNAALEQLGLVSLRSEGEGLLGLMDKCRSAAGRRLLRSRLLRPITDIAELERRLDTVDAAAARDPVTTERGLRALYDISRLWRRLELRTATMGDMGCLLRSYEAAASLGSVGTEFFAWLAARWNTAVTVELARESVIPVSRLPFVEGAYPEVDALFAEGLAIRGEAEALCESWSFGGKEKLYLDDAEGGGFRITGTKRRINAALTVLRDGGDLSATVVMYKTSAILETAELTAISARHRAWMMRWIPAWTAAWSAALAEIVAADSHRAASVATEAWCAELDVAWTVSAIGWKRPTFVEDCDQGYLAVEGLRHPVIERLVKVPYVAHDLELGGDMNGILLYGMNASGKSSLMKALGLCVLLAQAGFPVPAVSLRLAPFTAIFTRILSNDNLWAGLSSFAVEMTEFREILQLADRRSLVLGDELCSGTESLSATALVAAGVETLARRGTKFVFATHLHELAALPDIAGLAGVRAFHLKVHYDAVTDVLVYDRALAAGSGSALYGLEVCRALDLPMAFLERATTIRKALAGDVTAHRSVYSAGAVVDACAVCGSMDRLETHHIVAQADGGSDAAGNLVCLCAKCHDDHHGGRLTIHGWEETLTGRRLLVSRGIKKDDEDKAEVKAWVREQRALRVSVATIQRMARQIFRVELSAKEVRGS